MRKIITERLIMRPFDAADINFLIHLKGSPTNMAGTTVGPIDATQATIQLNHYRQQWKDLGLGMWSLTHKASGEFVGECGYVKRPDLDDFSLRYTLSDSWWGQGLTPEAVQAALHYGLNNAYLKEVSALALASNERSCRILETSGMSVVDNNFGGRSNFRRYQLTQK